MSMEHVTTLECTLCGAEYDPDQIIYTCSNHEGVRGILEVTYDYDVIHETFDAELDGTIPSQWKYEAFLPVDDDADPVTLDEGGTDLFEAPTLSEELGVETLVKDNGRNPTGCFKDRASSIAVTKARHAGREIITCASTGNAAASLSGYAARGGLDCRIFVPGSAPAGKLAQPLVYGADVLAVEGSYDEAYDLSVQVTEEYGWYNRNAAINPFQVEGKRTGGLELAEQCLVRGEIPDWLVYSMGDGCTIAGAWKGFREFYELGYVDECPRMLGVQAERAPAIHEAFHEHADAEAVAETLADSISVGRPRNSVKACRALEESNGTSVLVSDEEILQAEVTLGSTEGIFAEPAAAAPIAGVREALDRGIVDPGDTVVVDSTGFGLKDTKGAQKAAGEPERIDPDLAEVERLYGSAEAAAADD
ncbi:MAG: threonine synthase [Salinirussus sp.]